MEVAGFGLLEAEAEGEGPEIVGCALIGPDGTEASDELDLHPPMVGTAALPGRQGTTSGNAHGWFSDGRAIVTSHLGCILRTMSRAAIDAVKGTTASSVRREPV